MSSPVSAWASAVALFAQRKVSRLQRAYLGKGGNAASARASLARLRRLGMPGGASWISVGADLFDGFDELDVPEHLEGRALAAVTTALRLYAYHQQSKERPMALSAPDGGERHSRRGFGWSCRLIEFDPEKSKGVCRRMSAVEGTRDLGGAEHHLRALVTLMRANDVCVDYYQLTRDLFLMQFPDARDRVFMRWARDYHASVEGADGEHDGSVPGAAEDTTL